MSIEQPDYTVVAERDGYEIRQYDPFLVAETEVRGSPGSADNSAFRTLAGYIFGNNRSRSGVETMQRARKDGSEKMAMTAPVISATLDGDTAERHVYGFVMPSKYTLDTLPVPLDSSISFREVPARLVAVRRYSGRWQHARYLKHENLLMEALERDNVETVGEPMLARYNAPFMPGFLRRNEVIVEISPSPTQP